MYDRYLLGSLLVAVGTMGCYLSKWRWCLTLALTGAPPAAAPAAELAEAVDEERAETTEASEGDRESTPLSAAGRAKRKKVMFRQPLAEEMLVPALRDIPKYVRDDMFWGTEDYAAIRDNQRRLIELVMRQVRAYPEGVVPPPIPGESRRGLGIICEPGTNSGRAARVRSARRAVVEAYRDGYSPEMIGKLAAELSQWATKNAYDVGNKDQEAAQTAFGFDLDSFKIDPSYLVRADSSSESISSSRVARAARRSDQAADDPEATQQVDVDDGFGLASMIRNDSLSNLSAHAHSQLAPAPPAPVPQEQKSRDGIGLASMIRTDSLGNLSSLDVPPADEQLNYSLDQDYAVDSVDADYPVEAY
mmetsp:Transcript_6249/g.18939  ORF Transcript_6249/g.18939 Transcript_6249/m.18939 type:complete len:361 (-) Transcript_6249:489-1571(-)